jgi:hypothetical protein
MIRLEQIDGRACPVFICDECGERIRDFKMAIVVWDNSNQFRHLHKITCDHDKSLRWCELGEHLRHLLFNVGMGVSEIETEDELFELLGNL